MSCNVLQRDVAPSYVQRLYQEFGTVFETTVQYAVLLGLP